MVHVNDRMTETTLGFHGEGFSEKISGYKDVLVLCLFMEDRVELSERNTPC